MRRLRTFLSPGGVFALWSNEVPSEKFLAILSGVFDQASGHIVEFDNPIQGRIATNGVYIGKSFSGRP
jgi:hypothetical protein